MNTQKPKPHIWFDDSVGQWYCAGSGYLGQASTLKAAYKWWVTALMGMPVAVS